MQQPKQSSHWLDKITQEILSWQKEHQIKKLHVDDMKTLSGRIHTGSLRGVLLHDLIAKGLEEKGAKVTSTYVFNDMDPMDGLPSYLNQEFYTEQMGKPLYLIPAPPLDHCGIDLIKANKSELSDFQNAQNFAEFYALDFIHALRKLGCSQQIVWSHELYESGQMDGVIKIALDNVDKFRQIYQQVADYQLPEKWFPFQVICPQCGKLGTTLVTEWDGEQVIFECQKNKVEWAQGCGHQGKVSPFGGTGKLLWKVDWPAHWKVMGVTVEGAGKDHTSAGGSRDMANAICKNIFKITAPFDVPYEFLLVRGAKMSSSKGVGTSAREFTQLFPAEVGRFLFANRHFNQVIDFDPSSESIPDLYDEYDLATQIFHGQKTGDQRLARAYALAQQTDQPKSLFLPRFRDVAVWMQYPEIDLVEKFTQLKGSELNKEELTLLNERQKYAQVWMSRYAPKAHQFTPTPSLPDQANSLAIEQVEFFKQVVALVSSKPSWQPDELQQQIYQLAKSSIGTKQGFETIYRVLLGKTHGPKAAWLLVNTDRELLEKRVTKLEK